MSLGNWGAEEHEKEKRKSCAREAKKVTEARKLENFFFCVDGEEM